MPTKATVTACGRIRPTALLLPFAGRAVASRHGAPRPAGPVARPAHRPRGVLGGAHRPRHQGAPPRDAAPGPPGPPARPRLRLRTDRPHARRAGAGGDGVGGRRERAGPRAHPPERPGGGPRQRAGRAARGGPRGGAVRGHLVEPTRAHRQARAARAAHPLARSPRTRPGRRPRRAQAPRLRLAAPVAGGPGLAGDPAGEPPRLPAAGGATTRRGRGRARGRRGSRDGDGRRGMSRPLDSTGLKRLHRSWRNRPTGRVGLVLDNVQSPFNVGSILRTAAALRVDHLWLVGDTAPPTGAKTAKTALGTERYLRWSHHDTVAEAAEAARAGGYRVVGLELAQGATPLPELALPAAVCLVVGHEDRGLSPAALTACDDVAYIPQL